MDKMFLSDGKDMGSIPILNTNLMINLLFIGGFLMNLKEQLEYEKNLLNNKRGNIAQLEKECLNVEGKIAQLENEYNKMGIFTINDLGATLAHITSEIEDRNYLYQMVNYCDYKWTKKYGWRPNMGMICAIVEDSYKDCCFNIVEDAEKDPVIVAKIVCLLGGGARDCKKDGQTDFILTPNFGYTRGDTEMNFIGIFKNSAFPYLDDFIDKLVVYRYDKNSQVLDAEEITRLADEFIASKKKVDVKVIRKNRVTN